MKVFVIGPIFPYRGGIAHSNRMLCENLAENNDLTVISFSRMYPRLLYPGRDQKETTADLEFSLSVEYVLDSLNPFTWARIGRRIRREMPDRVIFQWWHTFFAPSYWLIRRRGRNPRTRFGVVCQNVLPHESSRFHERLTRFFFRGIHYFIALSRSDLATVQALLPGTPARWITERTSESQFGRKPSVDAARARLGVSQETLLFFGFVRPYKGLEYLLQALPAVIARRPRLTLVIAGEFWKNREAYESQIDALGLRPHVRVVDRYLSAEEVPTYFAAADAVVLPYVSSTESGIIQLAFGLNTPVITTAVGGNVDFIEHGKTGMLCRPQDPDDLARVILDFYEADRGPLLREGMRAREEQFAWTAEKERAVLGVSG